MARSEQEKAVARRRVNGLLLLIDVLLLLYLAFLAARAWIPGLDEAVVSWFR